MYPHAGMGGQMPPVQGYGHAGFASADQLREWQTQNCARTHGSSDQGYHGGGSRFAALGGGDDDPQHEHDSGEEADDRHPRAYDWPDELGLAQGQPTPNSGSGQQPPTLPVGGGGVQIPTLPDGYGAENRRAVRPDW